MKGFWFLNVRVHNSEIITASRDPQLATRGLRMNLASSLAAFERGWIWSDYPPTLHYTERDLDHPLLRSSGGRGCALRLLHHGPFHCRPQPGPRVSDVPARGCGFVAGTLPGVPNLFLAQVGGRRLRWCLRRQAARALIACVCAVAGGFLVPECARAQFGNQ